jgi:branched-chain amino acid transport system ATP-binding protein
MMILDTQEVTKRFGGLTAVNQVSMQVEEGQIYGLIGPNGAGKTTFLNAIAGTFPPTSGSVKFLGKVTTGMSADVMCRMGMSRTFQIPRPFPKLTVLENVKVGAVFGAANPGNKIHNHNQIGFIE